MTNKLIKAQKWAANIQSLLSRVEDCLHCKDNHVKKVPLFEIEELVDVNPLPCHEPGHAKLKVDKV